MVGWDYSRSVAHPQLEGPQNMLKCAMAQEEQEAIKTHVIFTCFRSFNCFSWLPQIKNTCKLAETYS